MASYFTTRVTVFKPGRAEQGQAALAAMARIAASILGASVRVFRDRKRPERYVTLGQWPDPAAFQAFVTHPDMAGVVPSIVAAFAEAYPADDQIDMDEVTP